MGIEALEISKTFLPRRGDQATMATIKSGIILSKGEFFLEYPNTGPGTKGTYRIKIGDGETKYKDLPYAIGDPSNNTLLVTDDNLGDIDFEEMMDAIKNGADISTIVNILKASIYDLNERYTEHDNDNKRHVTKEQVEAWNNSSVPEKVTNVSLNNLVASGHQYYGDPSNGCTEKPAGVDAFSLLVYKGGDNQTIQVLIESNNNIGKQWIRGCVKTAEKATWTEWAEIYSSINKQGTTEYAMKDALKQAFISTYIKSVTDTPSEKDVELSTVNDPSLPKEEQKKDVKKVHSHKMQFVTGDGNIVKDMTIEFDEANTQYQMHTNSKNGQMVNDGSVSIQLKSTDDTTNHIKIKGNGRGTNVSAVDDEIIVSSDYTLRMSYNIVEVPRPEPEEPIEPDDESDLMTTDLDEEGEVPTPEEPEYVVDGIIAELVDINNNVAAAFTIRAGYDTDIYLSGDNEIVIGSKADMIDINRIPAGAMERLVKVADDEARFALTTETVQNGDTVFVIEDSVMYMVVDDTMLSEEEGYLEYKGYTSNIFDGGDEG